VKTKAEKLLKKVERTLCRGSTFHYHSDSVKSINRALEKACAANGEAIDEIRAYFQAKPDAEPK
jgi:hypothetical protein